LKSLKQFCFELIRSHLTNVIGVSGACGTAKSTRATS
jgi:hypothetical protein